MSAPGCICVKMPAGLAEMLLRIVDENPTIVPPEHRVPLRSALVEAVSLLPLCDRCARGDTGPQ